MPTQIPLDLSTAPDYTAASFIKADCNSAAYELVMAPQEWPNRALALIGETGSGKTHLGHGFEEIFGAIRLASDTDITQSAQWRGQSLWLDEASKADEMLLFTLINMAIAGDIEALLVTGRTPPSQWPVKLPDLRSRLAAMAVTNLEDIDDELRLKIIEKMFKDKGLQVHDNVISYLAAHADRSVDALRTIIAGIDRQAAIAKVNVTRNFAAKYIQGDLF